MVFQNDILAGASGADGGEGGATINQSVIFNDADSPELSRTYTLNAPWTLSVWIKRGELGAENLILGASGGEVHFNSNNTLEAEGVSSTALFRDPTEWYHVYVSNNGMYVNGVSHGAITTTNLTNAKLFDDFDGYVAELHLQAGTTAHTDFGMFSEVTGRWVPKAAAAGDTYLTFSNAADFGENSGSGGAWTATNLASTDQSTDTPTNNFCTLNPLNRHSVITTSKGNLSATYAAGAYQAAIAGTTSVNEGSWYWETTVTTVGASFVGIAKATANIRGTEGANTLFDSGDCWVYAYTGSKYNGFTAVGYGASYTSGDVIGIAFDADAGTLTFYKNNATQGTAFTGLTAGPYMPINFIYSAAVHDMDFGQLGFTYTPPTGFNALNTTNLPEPAILLPASHHQTTLYTGNGTVIASGGNEINQTEDQTFQPDFVWVKERSGVASHGLYDVLRGVTKQLESDTQAAETTEAEGVTSFDADGFTVGSLAQVNTNADTYAAWQWKAGGAGVANTDGTISSTVSANVDAGFSIVGFTGNATSGATVGHGLSSALDCVMIKNRDQADAWQVYHSGVASDAETDYLVLNTTAATADNVNRWNDTAPTGSVFSLGNAAEVNTNTEDYIAYCWHSVEGYSKFGPYTGNGSADGAFVWTGFRPAYVMVKRTDSTSQWSIFDSQREGYNVDNDVLVANTTAAETTTDYLDITSTGFKLRSTSADVNASGGTYIYMAFAELPGKYSRAA